MQSKLFSDMSLPRQQLSQALGTAVMSKNPCLCCLPKIIEALGTRNLTSIPMCRFMTQDNRVRQSRSAFVANGQIEEGDTDSVLRCNRCYVDDRECYQV